MARQVTPPTSARASFVLQAEAPGQVVQENPWTGALDVVGRGPTRYRGSVTYWPRTPAQAREIFGFANELQGTDGWARFALPTDVFGPADPPGEDLDFEVGAAPTQKADELHIRVDLSGQGTWTPERLDWITVGSRLYAVIQVVDDQATTKVLSISPVTAAPAVGTTVIVAAPFVEAWVRGGEHLRVVAPVMAAATFEFVERV